MPLTDTFVRQVKHTGAPAGDKHTDGEGMFLHVKAAGNTSLCQNAVNQISFCTAGNLSEQKAKITKQQTQIEAQQKEIVGQKKEIEAQQKQIGEQNQAINTQQEKLGKAENELNRQRSELNAVKILVCLQNPTAELCKPEN